MGRLNEVLDLAQRQAAEHIKTLYDNTCLEIQSRWSYKICSAIQSLTGYALMEALNPEGLAKQAALQSLQTSMTAHHAAIHETISTHNQLIDNKQKLSVLQIQRAESHTQLEDLHENIHDLTVKIINLSGQINILDPLHKTIPALRAEYHLYQPQLEQANAQAIKLGAIINNAQLQAEQLQQEIQNNQNTFFDCLVAEKTWEFTHVYFHDHINNIIDIDVNILPEIPVSPLLLTHEAG